MTLFKRTRTPQETIDKIIELSKNFTTAEIAAQVGLNKNKVFFTLYRRQLSAKRKNRQLKNAEQVEGEFFDVDQYGKKYLI